MRSGILRSFASFASFLPLAAAAQPITNTSHLQLAGVTNPAVIAALAAAQAAATSANTGGVAMSPDAIGGSDAGASIGTFSSNPTVERTVTYTVQTSSPPTLTNSPPATNSPPGEAVPPKK